MEKSTLVSCTGPGGGAVGAMATTSTISGAELHGEVYTSFFGPEVLQGTIAKLVNNSTIFLNDTLIDVACLCMQSPIAINIGDRGIGLFRSNYNVAIPFKQLSARQLRAVTALVQHAYDNGAYYINNSGAGVHTVSIPAPKMPGPVPHAAILEAVYALILRSHQKATGAGTSLPGEKVADVILQRIRNLVYIDPQSLCRFQDDLRERRKKAAVPPPSI